MMISVKANGLCNQRIFPLWKICVVTWCYKLVYLISNNYKKNNKMSLDNYMNNQENLPEFLKDFHDQKDFFKALFEQYKNGNAKEVLENVNWVNAHIFTIDVFLWWMGQHGYKLQRTRKKGVDFYDPVETIKHYTNIRANKSIDFKQEP